MVDEVNRAIGAVRPPVASFLHLPTKPNVHLVYTILQLTTLTLPNPTDSLTDRLRHNPIAFVSASDTFDGLAMA